MKADGAGVLALERVVFSYERASVLRAISFTVQKGEFVGLLGPNGSGKSTLLRLACGLLSPQSGTVTYQGQGIPTWPKKSFAKEVAFVPQDFTVEFDFSIRELVLMGRTPHLGPLAWEKSEDHLKATEAMQQTDVLPLADRSVMEVSGGERQRACIAMALAQDPVLLLLDEPCSHLDIKHQFEVMALLSRLNREKGMTILVTGHDINLAAAYCHRILLLNEGTLAANGTPEDVFHPSRLREIYGVEASRHDNPLTGKPHWMFAEVKED